MKARPVPTPLVQHNEPQRVPVTGRSTPGDWAGWRGRGTEGTKLFDQPLGKQGSTAGGGQGAVFSWTFRWPGKKGQLPSH